MKFLLFVFTCFSGPCFGQMRQLNTLPPYDCSLRKLMTIIAKPTVLLTPDDNNRLQSITADYCGAFGNNCIQKTVSVMHDTDYLRPLFIIGEIKEFKNWAFFKLPIKKIAGGFEINNKKFTDSTDGFAMIDSNHIVVSGNSLQPLKDVQLAFTGGYDIQVVEKGKITFAGNQSGRQFNWFNLQELKNTNYTEKASPLFSAVYISKTFSDTIDYARLNNELKLYVQQFLGIYQIQMPSKKVSWFLHSNITEYGIMSGMFGLTCPGNNSAGFSIRGEIHTKGYDLGLVKHEYSHYLFDNNISQDNNPAFFVEGSVEYVTNINDSGVLKERLVIAKKYKDSLNYTNLVINNKDFYGQYSSANYSVCGIFVKYLIDKYGVNTFKKYCLTGDKQVATKDIFKEDFEDIVGGYRNWLERQ